MVFRTALVATACTLISISAAAALPVDGDADGDGDPDALSAQEGRYTFELFDYPGYTRTEAMGINNLGQIVGIVPANGDNPLNSFGFVLDDGEFEPILVPGFVSTEALGIDDLSRIVGKVGDGSSAFARGFLFDGVDFSILSDPNAANTRVTDINNLGQMAGWSNGEGFGASYSFIYDDGSYTEIPNPYSISPRATGINDFGQVVGWWPTPLETFNGFLWDGEELIAIRYQDSWYTFVSGINSHDQIVGHWHEDDTGRAHGFVLDDGVFTTFDVPDSRRTIPKDINDAGWIVGVVYDLDYVQHGFLATPRPRCGNGILEPGEDCDDGNNTSGDGCGARCRTLRTEWPVRRFRGDVLGDPGRRRPAP